MSTHIKWQGKPLTASKIIVCCSQAETGGPECLHQLVHELRHAGHEAFIAYYPFGEDFTPTAAYACYDAPQAKLLDEPEALVVIPEAATWIARSLRRAKVAINWLSVDNYFQRKHVSAWRDFVKRYKSLAKSRASLFELRHCAHLAQSHYALSFLRSRKLPAAPLGDYLSPDHLQAALLAPNSPRSNTIVFNPQKGYKYSQQLMSACPELSFVPLQNMSRADVIRCLQTSKLYMDFGHHPGKDRAPREAAIHGCCIITGRQGSAAFHEDVPIPDIYKLDESDSGLIERFRRLAHSIISDVGQHVPQFEPYREAIRNEPATMRRQVAELFALKT